MFCDTSGDELQRLNVVFQLFPIGPVSPGPSEGLMVIFQFKTLMLLDEAPNKLVFTEAFLNLYFVSS